MINMFGCKMEQQIKQKHLQKLREAGQRFAQHLEGINKNPKTLDENFKELLREPQVNLQPSKSGIYKIEVEVIPEGKEMTIVSKRNWIMMGYRPLKVKYDCPRLLFKLKLIKEGHRLLMSDSPQEMFLQYDAYKNAKGRVLTAGLGLGLYANMIAKKDNVKEVIVVEIDKDIIKLAKPKNKKIKVIQGDIWNFIRKTKEKFDYAYIDIHYHTGEWEYKQTVLPMKKIFDKRFPNMPVDFWGEKEMETQYYKKF